MTLSAAASRRLVHSRDIKLSGYLRADGQIEVEARMRDTKSYSMDNQDRSLIAAGEPLHDMWIRMTVTADEMEITACEASMDATPYAVCPQVAPNMDRLVGLKIGKGFLRAAVMRVGGAEGCTHLRELLQPVATVAYQTRYSLQNHEIGGQTKKREAGAAAPNPDIAANRLNSCYAYAETSPLMAHLRQEAS